MGAAEAAEVVRDEPLLQCGHPLSALVSGRVGRYCGACERELLREPPTRAQGSYLEDASEASEADQGEPDGDDGDEPDDTPDSEEDEQHSPVTVEADADESEPLEGDIIEPGQPTTQPVYGTLGTSPGPRGCWALNVRGEPCGAAARKREHFCNAHAGIGVAADPAAASRLGAQSRQRDIEQRARIRLALDGTRPTSIRGQLRLHAAQKSSEVAGRVVAAVLDPSADPIQAAKLGLQLVDAVEPVVHAEVSVSFPSDPAALDGLSLRELEALALAYEVAAPALDAPAEASVPG